eukprot:1265459-Prymnesium_polylepis.1
MRELLLDDQRVAYCTHPSPSTRISICRRRYSSCCASGFCLPSASSSAAWICSADRARSPPGASHASYSSIACAYCSTCFLRSVITRSSRRSIFSAACALSAARPASRAASAECRT